MGTHVTGPPVDTAKAELARCEWEVQQLRGAEVSSADGGVPGAVPIAVAVQPGHEPWMNDC